MILANLGFDFEKIRKNQFGVEPVLIHKKKKRYLDRGKKVFVLY